MIEDRSAFWRAMRELFQPRFRPTIRYYGARCIRSLCISVPYFVLLPLVLIFGRAFDPFDPWYLLAFVPAVPLVWIFISGIASFMIPFHYIRGVLRHDAEVRNGRVVTYYGAPGVGKTQSMTYDATIIAAAAYSELMLEYYKLQGQLASKKYADFDSIEDYWHWQGVREAVESIKPGSIPLLYSNYPIERGGAFSNQLKFDHFLQRKRLPENAVLVLDESADWLDNKRVFAKLESETAKENTLISEMMSKERHFGNWYMLLAEQSSEENYKGARNVMAMNRYLYARQDLCLPERLLHRRDKLLRRFQRGRINSVTYVERLKPLEERIAAIGFVRIYYRDRGNRVESDEIIGDGSFILPRNVDYRYATRAYEFQYRALDQPIDADLFGSKYLQAARGNTDTVREMTPPEWRILWRFRELDEKRQRAFATELLGIPRPDGVVNLTERERDLLAWYNELGENARRAIDFELWEMVGGEPPKK